MKDLPFTLILIISILFLFSCNQDRRAPQAAFLAQPITEAHIALDTSIVVDEAESFPDDARKLIKDTRKIIKHGELMFECSNLRESRLEIDALITQYEGYVSTEHESRYDDRIEQYVLIRIPSRNFERLLHGISQGISKFDRKQIEAVDVTEDYLDIEARLRIKKGTESRYIALLDRANTVEEILAIERQIDLLRSDIESIEGRLKYLQNQIGYSTLTVTLYEIILLPENSFLMRFLMSVRNGWELFMAFVLAVVGTWPFFLLLAVLFLGGYFYYVRFRKYTLPSSDTRIMKNPDKHIKNKQ